MLDIETVVDNFYNSCLSCFRRTIFGGVQAGALHENPLLAPHPTLSLKCMEGEPNCGGYKNLYLFLFCGANVQVN